MRGISQFGWFVLVACVACLTSNVQAGPLPLDPNALGGFKGTSTLSFTTGSLSVAGNIEYAVYYPGQFNLSFGAGSDPSNGTQYVYAYQVDNTGTVPAGGRDISLMGVTLLPTNSSTNIESLPLSHGNFGVVPAASGSQAAPPTTARWLYTSTTIGLGPKLADPALHEPEGADACIGGDHRRWAKRLPRSLPNSSPRQSPSRQPLRTHGNCRHGPADASTQEASVSTQDIA